MTPRENYRIYLSIAFDLEPWNPLIHNMVSERYGDSEFDPVSDEEEDSNGDEEEDLEASASATLCSSASQVVFGSFGGSVFTPVSSPWIAPETDGFNITIGTVPCSLADSSCSNRNSAIDASEENQKTRILDSELIVSAKSTNSTHRESEFIVSEAAFKQSKHLIIDTVITCFGPVYGVCCFAGKQEPIASADNNKIQFLKLHDESIVDFDPGGRIRSCLMFSVFAVLRRIQFRLWWIPWDRGKKEEEHRNVESCLFKAASICNFCHVLHNRDSESRFQIQFAKSCFKQKQKQRFCIDQMN